MKARSTPAKTLHQHSEANVLGVAIGNLTTPQILDRVRRAIHEKEKLVILPVNVNVIMTSRKDDELSRILRDGALTKSDGMPVVWAAKYLGLEISEISTGWVLFEEICRNAEKTGERVFFLGGKAGVPEKAAEVLHTHHPNLQVVGTYSPHFGFETDPEEQKRSVEIINKSNPDIVFVGMGVPKQEKWIAANKGRVCANVFMAVGGSFDFYAYPVRRPPVFVVRLGLGWLWRLVQEPARLGKRYLIDDSPFFVHILLQKLRGKRSSG